MAIWQPDKDSLLGTDIDFVLDEEALLGLLQCNMSSKPFRRALQLQATVQDALSPAFAVKRYGRGEITKHGIKIGGQELLSRIAANKLQDAEHCYAYIATCSRAIEERISACERTSDKYLLDQLAYLAYLQAMDVFTAEVEKVFGVERQVRLCPGSVIDWHVSQTKEVFALLGGLTQELNVSINDSGLMQPLKTTIGVFCAAAQEFDSCAICPRVKCPTRKADFDANLQAEMINL